MHNPRQQQIPEERSCVRTGLASICGFCSPAPCLARRHGRAAADATAIAIHRPSGSRSWSPRKSAKPSLQAVPVLGGGDERRADPQLRLRRASWIWHATWRASRSPISGPGQSQVAIRGYQLRQVIRDQPGVKEQVGVYLDESPISVGAASRPTSSWPISERFEVLRGPQGTLFGAGSEAGTLRYITRQPTLNGYEGSAEATFLGVQDGDIGGNVRGAVMCHSARPSRCVSSATTTSCRDSSTRFSLGGRIKKDVNDGDRKGGRVAMLFKPTEQLSITPRIVYQRLETNGYPREDVYNILAPIRPRPRSRR